MTADFSGDVASIQNIDAVPRILDVVCQTTGMGFAAVARVTEDRWVACAIKDEINFGLLPGGELQVATTICNEIRESGEAVAIDDVSEDDAYCGHPTPAQYGFQSYISVPIMLPDGTFFGTLCAIDPKPAKVNTRQVRDTFKLFAELIAYHLDASAKLASGAASLMDERKEAELREQFIAVLGHDLRNPLAAIQSGTRLLLKAPLDDKSRGVVTLMQNSAARMSGLIDNVLDFARGRLGSGLALSLNAGDPIEPVLRQVIEELQTSHPEQTIEMDAKLTRPVTYDPIRLSQLFSNLVGNALMYGSKDKPVRIRAHDDGAAFELTVSNAGIPIPAKAMERLFYPFSRGEVRKSKQGLGLGLYIASEIARAHGGTLTATSSREETCFTFRMPIGDINSAR